MALEAVGAANLIRRVRHGGPDGRDQGVRLDDRLARCLVRITRIERAADLPLTHDLAQPPRNDQPKEKKP